MDCHFVGWCGLTPDQQAAWFQGIASVLAILIAIAVPGLQHWLEDRRRRGDQMSRARSVAMSLFSDFFQVDENLKNVWMHESPENFEDVPNPVLGHFTEIAIKLPAKLDAMADRLHELGPAAPPAQKVIFHLRRAAEYTAYMHEEEEIIIFNKDPFYEHLWQASQEITWVHRRISEMFQSEA